MVFKTIKELEAELNNHTMGSPEYMIIIGKIEQANHMLGLIDERIQAQKDLMSMTISDNTLNTCECIIMILEELKARINGK